jgi:hypothetical protein
VGELLRREGRVAERRRRRRREPHPGPPQWSASAPNDLWTADFKGQFRTRDWDWCYPLTVLDHVSRNCLGLQALDGTDGDGVHQVFERLFREAGLPLAILTDNGPPFVAPRGLHGLTKLSVWWIRLGIHLPSTAHPPQQCARRSVGLSPLPLERLPQPSIPSFPRFQTIPLPTRICEEPPSGRHARAEGVARPRRVPPPLELAASLDAARGDEAIRRRMQAAAHSRVCLRPRATTPSRLDATSPAETPFM